MYDMEKCKANLHNEIDKLQENWICLTFYYLERQQQT